MRTRPLIVALVSLALVLALGLAGTRLASRQLEAELRGALGPRAAVGSIAIGWTGIEVHDLRIRGAGSAWPAADELRAQRVRLRPSLASLWSEGWRIAEIEVEQASLAIQRTRQGRLRVLPAVLERPQRDDATPAPRVHVARIVLRDAAIDFHDASVRRGSHRVRLEAMQAEIGPLDFPHLDGPAGLELSARLSGPSRDGTLAIAGTLTPATRDAELSADVRGVDLVALQPYLLKVNETGVKGGTLDLSLKARVQAQRLHAPGRLALTGLELAAGGGVLGTFAGVPRQAVLAAMQRDGRIEVGFTLEGRLDDPAFSLNENFATRLAGSLAETLGISLGGVVEGVGSVIKGLFGR